MTRGGTPHGRPGNPGTVPLQLGTSSDVSLCFPRCDSHRSPFQHPGGPPRPAGSAILRPAPKIGPPGVKDSQLWQPRGDLTSGTQRVPEPGGPPAQWGNGRTGWPQGWGPPGRGWTGRPRPELPSAPRRQGEARCFPALRPELIWVQKSKMQDPGDPRGAPEEEKEWGPPTAHCDPLSTARAPPLSIRRQSPVGCLATWISSCVTV